MPVFTYHYIDETGHEATDTVEAVSREAAADQLRTERRVVTRIEEMEISAERGGARFDPWSLFSFVTATDLVIFFREFAALVRAGVPVVGSLELLETQATKRRLRRAVARVRRDVEGGSSMADAMRPHRGLFSPLVVSMVSAGEAGGFLESTFERIADLLEARASFRSQVSTALLYPSVVVVAIVVAVWLLTAHVVPNIMTLMTAFGRKLPAPTRMLLDVLDWLQTWWTVLTASGLGVLVMLVLMYLTAPGRNLLDRAKLYLPLMGRAFHYSALVLFARNLGALLESGVPVLEALLTARNAVGNEAFARLMDRTHARVAGGDSLAAPLREARGLVPPLVAGMVSVGEETGGLVRSLDLVGDIYERLLQVHVQRVVALITPMVTVLIAGVVFFVGYSLLSLLVSLYRV